MKKGTPIAVAAMMISMVSHAETGAKVEIPPAIQAQIRALGCDACHGPSRTKFGPSWQNVADRYRGETSYEYKGFNINSAGEKLPLLEGLVKKVQRGGKGEWNDYIPMAASDINGRHTQEITDIVNFILTIPAKK